MVGHFDTCLGCMACETACPSGVRYAPLIEETRAAIEQHHERPARRSPVPPPAVHCCCPIPARLRVFALPLVFVNLLRGWPGLLALLPRRLSNLIELAPDVDAVGTDARARAHARRRHALGCASAC